MKTFSQENPQTSFGALKPVGNIIIVFEDDDGAESIKTELLKSARQPEEITKMSSDDLIELADEMKSKSNAIAVLGSEMKKLDELREQAERGASFLVVYAPSDEETAQVMKIVENHKFRFALKYGHMLIERFDAEHSALSN